MTNSFKPKKTNGKKLFEKGNKFGQGGRPKTSKEVRLLQKDTSENAKKLICETWNSDYKDLLNLAQRTDLQAGKALLASCMVTAIQDGSFKHLDLFLNRVIGKPVETFEISSAEEQNELSERDVMVSKLVSMIVDKE